MSIQELSQKFKGIFLKTDVLLTLLIISVSLTSFYLGKLSNIEKSEEIQSKIKLQEMSSVENQAVVAPVVQSQNFSSSTDSRLQAGSYVASKSGTKYHLPWCSGAKRIKEENKIWFSSKEDAEKAGYEPAANCKGI